MFAVSRHEHRAHRIGSHRYAPASHRKSTEKQILHRARLAERIEICAAPTGSGDKPRNIPLLLTLFGHILKRLVSHQPGLTQPAERFVEDEGGNNGDLRLSQSLCDSRQGSRVETSPAPLGCSPARIKPAVMGRYDGSRVGTRCFGNSCHVLDRGYARPCRRHRVRHPQMTTDAQIEGLCFVDDGTKKWGVDPCIYFDEVGSRGHQLIYGLPGISLCTHSNCVRVRGRESVDHGSRGVHPWSVRRRLVGLSSERGERADSAMHVADRGDTPGEITGPCPRY